MTRKKATETRQTRAESRTSSLIPWSASGGTPFVAPLPSSAIVPVAAFPEGLQALLAVLLQLRSTTWPGLEAEVHDAALTCVPLILEETHQLLSLPSNAPETWEALGATLLHLANAPWEELGEAWFTRWIQACLRVATLTKNDKLQQTLGTVARMSVPSGEEAVQIEAFSTLLAAGSQLEAKNAFLARVAAGKAQRHAGATPEIVLTAKEIDAKAHASVGNTEGEIRALREWWEYGRDNVGGVIRQAGSFLLSGIGAEARGSQMLETASHFITLLENAGDYPFALEICQEFINLCLPHWESSAPGEPGTIRERAARLQRRISGPDNTAGPARRLSVIHVQRELGEISQTIWDRAAASAMNGHLGSFRVLVTELERVNLNRFAVGVLDRPAHQQVAETATAVVADAMRRRPVLEFWSANETGGGDQPGLGWVVVEHDERHAELRHVVFAIRPAVVGDELQLSVYAGIGVPPYEAVPGFDVLPLDPRCDMTSVPGFDTLRDAVVAVLLEAGKRLESSASVQG